MWKNRAFVVLGLTVTILAAGLIGGHAAWALPSLQIGFEESLNSGQTIYYDPVTETSFISGTGPYVMTAYAQDSAFDPDAPGNYAFLSVSLDPDAMGEFDDPSSVTVWVDSVQVAPPWTWGTPPLDEFLIGQGDLPSHGQFPSWNAQVMILIDTPTGNLPNVQDGEITNHDGYTTNVSIEIAGNVGLHLDLYTLNYNPGWHYDEIYAFAPFSHDGGIPPVPEPATAMMLVVGGLVAAAGSRRRRRDGQDALDA